MSLTVDLSGTVAVVTGASSGIGRHLCGVLACNGAIVVAAARRADRLKEVVELHSRVRAEVCDVTDAEDCEQVIRRAQGLGDFRLLVNAAGSADPLPALETKIEQFRWTLEVDLTSVFRLSVLAARAMPEGGSVINIASIFGLVGSWPVTQAAYTAAKGGVVNLTRQLGAEWARLGVRVNAIAPGWFPSELTEQMFADERSMAWIRRNTPIGRPGRLDELDGPVLMLADPASSYITGQVLAVDGGWTAH